MKVLRLKVDNLGPIESIELDLAPVNVLSGPNDAGKSFILDALEVLRFGTCRGLKVQEAAELTHNGKKGWRVGAVLDDGEVESSIVRTRSQKPTEAELVEKLGDPRTLRALLHVQSFLDMTPADRQALVADLVTRDTSELLVRLRALKAEPAILVSVEAGKVKTAHNVAVKLRQAISRELKEAEVRAVVPTCPDVATKKGPRPISTLTADLIEKALSSADDFYAETVRINGWTVKNKSLIEKADAAAEQLKELPEPSWDEKKDKALRTEKAARLENRTKAAKYAAERDLAIKESAELGVLLKEGDDCPTCGQSLSSVKTAVKSRQGELQGDANRAYNLLTVLAASDKEMVQNIKALEEEQRSSDGLDTQRLTLESLVSDAESGRHRTKNRTAEDVADALAEVKRLRDVKQTRALWDARMEESAHAKAKVDGLKSRLPDLEAIERATDPSKMEGEADVLETLNELLRKYAPPLLGGPIVDVAPGWHLYIGGRSEALASDSKRMRAGVVCALALAIMSGLRCVFVDRLESLDEAARPKLVGLLGKMTEAGELDTAILALVRANYKPMPKLAWLKGIHMVDGEVFSPEVKQEDSA